MLIAPMSNWKREANPPRATIENGIRDYKFRRFYSQREINHHMPQKLHHLLDLQVRHISKELGISQKAPKPAGTPSRSRR